MLFNNNGTFTNDADVSMESMSYIMEGLLMDNLSKEELSVFLESKAEVDAALSDNIVMEKTIVRLDKHAKLSRAYKAALFAVANEKNDPRYKKLVKVWRMERYLENELDKKYKNEAMRRAKKTVAAAAKSKSNVVKKAASKAKDMFNDPTAKPKPMKKPEFINVNNAK